MFVLVYRQNRVYFSLKIFYKFVAIFEVGFVTPGFQSKTGVTKTIDNVVIFVLEAYLLLMNITFF